MIFAEAEGELNNDENDTYFCELAQKTCSENIRTLFIIIIMLKKVLCQKTRKQKVFRPG